ncbi:MAG: hypothetical protein GY861_21740 [bacterium]|nr:hypothetical protein [bacterium]
MKYLVSKPDSLSPEVVRADRFEVLTKSRYGSILFYTGDKTIATYPRGTIVYKCSLLRSFFLAAPVILRIIGWIFVTVFSIVLVIFFLWIFLF